MRLRVEERPCALCRDCLIAGELPVVALKVHSDMLDADVWVVTDELPPEQWPIDGTAVYAYRGEAAAAGGR